ncbi:unnamed protein product [Heterobilharzia americana]|nr:unnamed protein product [Heterobilharzia americana]CAH8658168.1 unnamed protein product [Heterobilharzia americana]
MESSKDMFSLVNKQIRLYCIEDRVFTGFVYTVDPKTGNYVLYSCVNERYQPIVVRREAVKSLEILDGEIPLTIKNIFDSLLPSTFDGEYLSSKKEEVSTKMLTATTESTLDSISGKKVNLSPVTITPEELERRREKIIQLFTINHLKDLTVTDEGEIVIYNMASIKPPYHVSCCTGRNMIVLDRVKTLLGKLAELEEAEKVKEDID